MVASKFSDGNDFVRPLTDAGATDVTHVAEWLKDLGVKFDAIITSPLKRAYQTFIVSKIFNIENNLIRLFAMFQMPHQLIISNQ